MKKLFAVGVFLFSCCFYSTQAQQVPQNHTLNSSSPVKLSQTGWNKLTFSFGKIPLGRPVTTQFQWKNTGGAPLSIKEVVASCGCTTPIWTKSEIKPGQSAVVELGYNAAAEGPFSKPVTVLFSDGTSVELTITGEVYPLPSTPAPKNESIEKLKSTKFTS